ncbi:MAG: sulfotransferase, partial [Paracoccaceae bacterium]
YVHEWTERNVGADAEAAFRSETTFIDYGCYGMQIAPFVQAYGLENILLTSLEAVKADPDGEFARVAAHLGLPATAAWQHDVDAQNVSSARFRRLPFQGLIVDNPVARALRHALVPKSVRRRIREGRQMTHRPEIPADLEARMKARFLEDRDVLAQFFPDHPALEACYPFAAQ